MSEKQQTGKVDTEANAPKTDSKHEIVRNESGQVIMYKSGGREIAVNDTPDNIEAMISGGWSLEPKE